MFRPRSPEIGRDIKPYVITVFPRRNSQCWKRDRQFIGGMPSTVLSIDVGTRTLAATSGGLRGLG